MMKGIVLQWEGGKESYRYYEHDAILPNVQGQTYVFGSKYPGGEREGEEFIFCRYEGIRVDLTQFVIRVDELGQYWIQSETTKFKTFVNSEMLLEPRLLQIEDIIFLEDSEIRYGYARSRYPIFSVKKTMLVPAWSGLGGIGWADSGNDNDSDSDSEGCRAMKEPDVIDEAESPLDNTLIMEKIMSYLTVWDLKRARLVCKKWKDEFSKALEKRGKVSFYFDSDYLKPKYSTRVFRYLNEMRNMKMRNLHISFCSRYYRSRLLFSPGEAGQKMMDDLRKLLKSPHNFSTLFLQAKIEEESDFHFFTLILKGLGEKLAELQLEVSFLFLPAVLPLFPVMRSLKKLTDTGYLSSNDMKPRWVSHIVPLFSNILEHFTCWSRTSDPYLQEFLKHRMPNLKGITLKDEASVRTLSALLGLKTPLTFLAIQFSNSSTEAEELLESLLLKNSKSLERLVIRIGNVIYPDKNTEVSFPSFQSLKELELEYGPRTRVSWESNLDYEDHFPSLRKLTVRPRQQWREDDHVPNAFFPRRELRCGTVKELSVPVLPNPMLPYYMLYVPFASFQPRMKQIRKMFPSAGKINFFK